MDWVGSAIVVLLVVLSSYGYGLIGWLFAFVWMDLAKSLFKVQPEPEPIRASDLAPHLDHGKMCNTALMKMFNARE